MKDEIKKALEKATVGPWEFGVFEDSRHIIYDSTYLSRHIAEIVRGGVENEQREEDNAFLIANAPTWLRWQNERIEQLEKALEMAMPIVEHNSPTLTRIINHTLGKEE